MDDEVMQTICSACGLQFDISENDEFDARESDVCPECRLHQRRREKEEDEERRREEDEAGEYDLQSDPDPLIDPEAEDYCGDNDDSHAGGFGGDGDGDGD